MTSSVKPLSRSDYHVAWICPVADVELLPARLMLDEEHPTPPYDTYYDENTYICGSINGHAVVIATCPQGETGNVNAGRLTGSMFKTFPNIRMAMLVGIGGGIPRPTVSTDSLENIHLGDVVVGWPGDGKPACVYHDRGRSKGDGQFELVGTMQNPEWRLIQALSKLGSDYELGCTRFDDHIARLQYNKGKRKFEHPGLEHDNLFNTTYGHVGGYESRCKTCDQRELVQRPGRIEVEKHKLVFHLGRIATGNAVIQDGKVRDEISQRCGGAICVEMEAAGVDANRKCLVIRGISDYADSHKSEMWRSYAAGNAAAFARELLCKVQSATVRTTSDVSRPVTAEAERMDDVLLTLQSQMNQISHQLRHTEHTSRSQKVYASKSDVADSGTRSPLVESIEVLQKLVSEEGILCNDKAENFLDKLACILESIPSQQHNFPLGLSQEVAKVYYGFPDISPRDLRRICGVITSAYNVCINADAPRLEVTDHERIVQIRKGTEVYIQGYKIRITTVERKSSNPRRSRSRLVLRTRCTDTLVKVQVFHSSKAPAVITAYVRYQQGLNGSQSLNPIISVGRTLPKGSLVFTLVQNGDVEQLKRLLAGRQCTLRDRDTFGTPLLHYALKEPNMCKFLIDNGADIDELAHNVQAPEYENVPLYEYVNDDDRDKDDLRKIIECRRLLLDAGADPTIRDAEGGNVIENVVQGTATVDSLKSILDAESPFIHIDMRDEDGRTLLMVQATGMCYGYSVEMFELLLDRGADIHARDFYGRTALHIAAMSASVPSRNGRDVEALEMLIKRGGNYLTTDYSGRSIFEDVYECDHEGVYNTGSYKGDLWDATLSRCRLGEHVWSPEERLYHYTKYYTEVHFRQLWDGWEHLYPYDHGMSSPCRFHISVQCERRYDYVHVDKHEHEEEHEEQEDGEEESQREGGVVIECYQRQW